MEDDTVWRWTLGLCAVALVGFCLYMGTRDDEPLPAVTGSWPAPSFTPAAQDHNGSFSDGYFWGHLMSGGQTHHEQTVHHVYHPAPNYTPAPVVVRATPAEVKSSSSTSSTAGKPTFRAATSSVSAIKTSGSSARSMSSSSFRSGGRR